jgi:hypothetical protein
MHPTANNAAFMRETLCQLRCVRGGYRELRSFHRELAANHSSSRRVMPGVETA